MFLPVPTPLEMRRWDAEAVALGVPETALMENAAREALAVLRRRRGPLNGARILLFAGSGNNGGDASCLARHLLDAGALPVLALTRPLSPDQGAAGLYLDLSRRLGVEIRLLAESPDEILAKRDQILSPRPDIIVDGLLGTGFQGDLRRREAALVDLINSARDRAFVLSLDVPSGLDALTGHPRPRCVRAHCTVAFQAAKPGLVTPEASAATGVLEVRPIGMPLAARQKHPASCRLWLDGPGLEPAAPYILHDARPSSRRRRGYPASRAEAWDGPRHKGEAGKVLLAGGSPGLSGAIRLAARGALRGGAGLICVSGPEETIRDVRVSLPEAITIALPSPENAVWPGALPGHLRETLHRYGALVAGPGMGRMNGSAAFLRDLLAEPGRPPAVLDADALHALGHDTSLRQMVRRNDVLTPHPGEAAALLGVTPAQVQEGRLAALEALAETIPAVWVLKGAGTLAHVPDDPVTVFPHHVPALAVGGSGDVLAGLIGALIAGGREPGFAAVMGTQLHALAGLSLSRPFPRRGNSPEDIADAIPRVLPILDGSYPLDLQRNTDAL